MDEELTRIPTGEPPGGDPPCWQHLLDEAGRPGRDGDPDAERMREYLLGPDAVPPASEG